MLEIDHPVNLTALKALQSVLGDAFPELIHDFNIHSCDCLLKLEHAAGQSDRASIKSLAHSLKGSALSLHAKSLADLCGDLEAEAHCATMQRLNQLILQIHEEVRAVLEVIEEWAY